MQCYSNGIDNQWAYVKAQIMDNSVYVLTILALRRRSQPDYRIQRTGMQ